jgi:hypothetical protein
VHRDSDAIVAAARACCGTRFEPQGRLPGAGLDCVGVALAAASAARLRVDVPPYHLGGDHEARLDDAVRAIGCRPVSAPAPGDLLVLAPGPRRRHLAVVVPGGVVHAHAGLGRVVEGPLDPAWRVVAAWRSPDQE